jgi:PD-(D/E)XK nuclease superfamily
VGKVRLRVVNGSGPRKILARVASLSGELAESLAVESVSVEAPPAELVRLVRPTMSKTDLLFACSYPWFKSAHAETVGERTRFGSAFHEGAEAILRGKRFNAKAGAKKWDVDVDELRDRVGSALPVLLKWLRGSNMWGLDFTRGKVSTEVTAALNMAGAPTRLLPGGPGDAHDYPEALEEEFPGTADLISVAESNSRILLVLDHKSGWNVAADWQPRTPAENGQLRSLATAFADLYAPDLVIVAFFHAPLEGLPQVMADELTPVDLEAHRIELKRAWKRLGNGWLHPGDWCSYCPAWSVCPTNTTSLTVLQRAGGPLTAQRVGAIHQARREFNRMSDRLGEEIRAWVAANGPGECPDGSTVELVEKMVERLSKSSVLAALGPDKGNAMLDSLRACGALAERPQLELRAVKSR